MSVMSVYISTFVYIFSSKLRRCEQFSSLFASALARGPRGTVRIAGEDDRRVVAAGLLRHLCRAGLLKLQAGRRK